MRGLFEPTVVTDMTLIVRITCQGDLEVVFQNVVHGEEPKGDCRLCYIQSQSNTDQRNYTSIPLWQIAGIWPPPKKPALEQWKQYGSTKTTWPSWRRKDDDGSFYNFVIFVVSRRRTSVV